jgi:hypothetical protein
MNISGYSSLNETSLMLIWERLLFQMGSTVLLDTLYVYLITPIGLLGFILNLISLIILCKLNSKQTVYIYFKVYTIVGMLVCATLMLMLFVRAPRYLRTVFTYLGSIYRCKIFTAIFSVFLFGTLINICILFERISNFKPIFKNYFRKKPAWIICTCLAISIVINIPLYMSVDARPESDFQEAFQNYDAIGNFMYCSRPAHSTTLVGRILLFLSSFFNGCLFLVIEIVVNFLSLYKFKKFYKNKKRVLNQLGNKKLAVNTSILRASREPSSLSTFNTNKQLTNDAVDLHANRKSNLLKITVFSSSKSTRKLTIMSLTFSGLSIVTNVIGFVCGVIFTFNNPNTPNNRNSLFLLVLFVMLKYFSSFFLFYYLNRNFRDYFLNVFKKRTSF